MERWDREETAEPSRRALPKTSPDYAQTGLAAVRFIEEAEPEDLDELAALIEARREGRRPDRRKVGCGRRTLNRTCDFCANPGWLAAAWLLAPLTGQRRAA